MGAVIFDLDGTLLDTEAPYERAFHAAMDAVGFTLPPAQYTRIVGLPTPARIDRLRRLFGSGFPCSLWRSRYYAERARLLAGGVPLRRGAASLLASLETAGVPCAVATSASRATAMRHLNLAGLSGRFARVVTRDDVRRAKPHPESFLRAAFLLGVTPEHCVALEDSEPGMRSAAAAGMALVLVSAVGRPALRTAARCAAARDLHHARVLVMEFLQRAKGWNVQPAA